MKNKQIIKALTIGISANMLLNPVVAFAEDLSDDESKENENADASENGDDKVEEALESTNESSYEDTKKEITDTATELVVVSSKLEEADKVDNTDYKESKEATDYAADELREAAKDVQASSDALDNEKNDYVQMEASAKLTEESVLAADKTYDESEDASEDAVKEDESIDVDTSSESDATQAIQAIENDLKIADSKLKDAESDLSTARDSFDTANKEYEALLSDKNASEEALSDAKNKVVEAESALLEARKNVEENAKVAEELEKDIQKYETYNCINKLNEELANMSSSDEGYSESVDALSELIIKYYLFDKIDKGSAVDIKDDSEEYIVDYQFDSEGNPEPVYKNIPYKSVTFTVDGKEVTRKINYNCDDNGIITISEKNITAEEAEITVLPKREVVFTDEAGNAFDETPTSHKVLKNTEDEDEGFFAIDTASSEVISEKDLLPTAGSSTTFFDDDNNTVKIDYKSIAPIENADTKISYELDRNGIAEIKTEQYDVEYISSTEYSKTVTGFNRKSEAEKAAEILIEELKNQYGDSFISYKYDYTPHSFTLYYTINEEKSEVIYLPVSRTVYEAKEFVDRSPSPTYVDDEGNEYEEDDWIISVYIDPKNKDLGLYAADIGSQWLQDEYFNEEGDEFTFYERDEQGRHKETSVEYVNKLSENETRTRETFYVIDDYTVETTIRELEDNETIYDVLNSYQRQNEVTVTLKGKDSSAWDYVVDYGIRDWYIDAEDNYDLILNNAGGCEIEITRSVPVTREVTGIAVKNYAGYRVFTSVSVENAKSGICKTEEEAQQAIDAIIEDAFDISYGVRVNGRSVKKIVTEDGGTAWKYEIDYVLFTERGYSLKDELAYAEYYDCTKYMNADAKTEKIYNLTLSDNTLLRTDDIKFRSFISDRNKAYDKAIKEKEKVEAVTDLFEEALKVVERAKKAVEALEAAAVPQTILDEATAKYNTARTNLVNVLHHKENAEISFEKAKESLKDAEDKLAKIRAKSTSGGQSEESRVEPGNIADAGSDVSSYSPGESGAVYVVQTSTAQTNQNTVQPQEAVLGDTRVTETKVVNVKNIDNKSDSKAKTEKENAEKKDTVSENETGSAEKSNSENSLGTDNTSSKDNSDVVAINKEIEDEKPALSDKPEEPEQPEKPEEPDKPVNSKKLPTAVVAVIAIAGVAAASWLISVLLKIRLH